METWDDKQTKWKSTGPQQTKKGLSDGSYHHSPWAIRGPLPSTLPPSPSSARMNSGISECRPRWMAQCVLLASSSSHLPTSPQVKRGRDPPTTGGKSACPTLTPARTESRTEKKGRSIGESQYTIAA